MRGHDDDGATEDTYNDRSYFLSFLRRQVDGAFRKKKTRRRRVTTRNATTSIALRLQAIENYDAIHSMGYTR